MKLTRLDLILPPKRDEMKIFRRGLLIKLLLIALGLLIIFIDEGPKTFLWYLAAPVMIYLILMLGVIEDRLKATK